MKTAAFWDLHIHGVSNHDFIFSKRSDIFEICCFLGQKGLGFFAPTLLTSNFDTLEKACSNWGEAITELYSSRKPLPARFAFPIGIHCEGPFLNPKMAGAHPQQWIQPPSIPLLKTLIQSSKNQLKIITMAPELPGALKLISFAQKQGIRVQIGHTMTSAQEAHRAFQAGAQGITHLFNAMRFHHRSPGAFAGLISGFHNKHITAELITDLKHLDPHFSLFCVEKLSPKLYAVSDRCCEKSLGELSISSKNGVAFVKGSQTMAGSTLNLTQHPSLWKKQFSSRSGSVSSHFWRDHFWGLFFEKQSTFFRPETRILKRLHPKLFTRKISFDDQSFEFLGS